MFKYFSRNAFDKAIHVHKDKVVKLNSKYILKTLHYYVHARERSTIIARKIQKMYQDSL